MEKNTGFKRIFKAGVYSLAGIRAALVNEAAFRQEAISAILVLPVAFLVDVDRIERVALVVVTMLVLVVELLNSAVEAVVDRIGPEMHELSGRAKDIGSAAVLLSLLLWAYVWIEIVIIGLLMHPG